MSKNLLDKARASTGVRYAVAVIFCLIILTLTFKLWRAELSIPFHYDGDALQHSVFIKGTLDNGWYWQNKFIGMPTGLKMYDYPAVDNQPFLLLMAMSLFSSKFGVILNLFFLLTFPLTTITALFAMSRLGVTYGPALVGSLLYTFFPYHLYRGESHLFLAAYYLIP